METNIIIYVVAWVAASVLVALVGKNRNIGFGITLIISLFLSPFLGLIAALVSKKDSDIDQRKWQRYKDQAEKETQAGNIAKAVDLYNEAIEYLERNYRPEKTPDGVLDRARHQIRNLSESAYNLVKQNPEQVSDAENKLNMFEKKKREINPD